MLTGSCRGTRGRRSSRRPPSRHAAPSAPAQASPTCSRRSSCRCNLIHATAQTVLRTRIWNLVLMAAQWATIWLEGCAPNSEPKMLGRDMPVAAGSISIGRRLLHSCRSNPSAPLLPLWTERRLLRVLPVATGSPHPGGCPQPAARRRAGRARGSLAPGPRAGAARACRIAQPSPPHPCRPGARSTCPLHSPIRLPNSKRCAKACQKTSGDLRLRRLAEIEGSSDDAVGLWLLTRGAGGPDRAARVFLSNDCHDKARVDAGRCVQKDLALIASIP